MWVRVLGSREGGALWCQREAGWGAPWRGGGSEWLSLCACGEIDKARGPERMLFSFVGSGLLFFFFFSHFSSCLGFLKSRRPPGIRASLCGYPCHLLPVLLVYVSFQNSIM